MDVHAVDQLTQCKRTDESAGTGAFPHSFPNESERPVHGAAARRSSSYGVVERRLRCRRCPEQRIHLLETFGPAAAVEREALLGGELAVRQRQPCCFGN